MSAGPLDASSFSPSYSFSILGWIDWCLLEWLAAYLAGGDVCFSILGWIDWCLLGRSARSYGSSSLVFQYPRVDRLVSAGWPSAEPGLARPSFSILGWIDWCLLGGMARA